MPPKLHRQNLSDRGLVIVDEEALDILESSNEGALSTIKSLEKDLEILETRVQAAREEIEKLSQAYQTDDSTLSLLDTVYRKLIGE